MKLIFQHIPKAGGSTFHAILEHIYAKEVIHDIEVRNGKLTIEDFTELSEHQRNRIKLLKGHMPYGLHHYFRSEEDVKYITYFRDPVKRIISHYYYVLRTPVHYLYKEVTGKKMSLQEYALSDLTDELDNGQVRLLVEEQIPLNEVKEIHLQQAIHNLENHFEVFGLMERFDESLILFKDCLQWEAYPYYRRLNVTKEKPFVSQEVKEEIERRNHFDVSLYQYAKKAFEEKLSTIDNLAHELKLFQQINQVYKTGFEEGFEIGKKAPFKKLLVVKAGKSIYNSIKRQLKA